MLRGCALGVPGGDPHPRMAPPLGSRRLHASLADVSSGIFPTYQGIYFASSCHFGCGDIGIGDSPLPVSTSGCPALVCGWLLMPADGLPMPPEEPPHVSFSSQGTLTKPLVCRMAGTWQQPHCIVLLPAGWCPPISTNGLSARTRCPE